MPLGSEERYTGQYLFRVWNESWGEPGNGLWVNFTMEDGSGSLTEAEMDVIGQDIVDRLVAGGFDTVAGFKAARVSAPINPTP